MLSLYGDKEYIKLDNSVYFAEINKEEEGFLLKKIIEDGAGMEEIQADEYPELIMATKGSKLIRVFQCYSVSDPGVLLILKGDDVFYELY